MKVGGAALKALLLCRRAAADCSNPPSSSSLCLKGGRGGYRRKGPYTIPLLTLRSMAGMIWYYTAEVVVVEGTRPHRCFLLLEKRVFHCGTLFTKCVGDGKRLKAVNRTKNCTPTYWDPRFVFVDNQPMRATKILSFFPPSSCWFFNHFHILFPSLSSRALFLFFPLHPPPPPPPPSPAQQAGGGEEAVTKYHGYQEESPPPPPPFPPPPPPPPFPPFPLPSLSIVVRSSVPSAEGKRASPFL